MVPIAARLKEARKRKNLKQKEVAAHIQMAAHSYQQYEGGKRRPDYETLVAIADYLNVTTDYLLGRTDEPGQGAHADHPGEDHRPPRRGR